MQADDPRQSISRPAAACAGASRRNSAHAVSALLLAAFGCGGSSDAADDVGSAMASDSNASETEASNAGTESSGNDGENPVLSDDVPPSVAEASAETVSLPSEFEELTVTSFGGFVTPSPPGAGCDAFSYSNRFQLDSASRTLAWDWCVPAVTNALRQGTRVLDDAELSSVTSAYSKASLAPGECESDYPFGLLDVRSGTVVQHYAVAGSACYTGFGNLTYVNTSSFFDLVSAFQQLTR